MNSLNIPQIYDVREKDYNWFLNHYSDSISKDIIIYQHPDKDLCLGDYSVFTTSLHMYDNIYKYYQYYYVFYEYVLL